VNFQNYAIQSLGWSKKLETWPKLTLKIRWLAPKTYLLPQPQGRGRVKFYEFIITQLLGYIEN